MQVKIAICVFEVFLLFFVKESLCQVAVDPIQTDSAASLNFELADINIIYREGSCQKQLEAFKSSENDKILASKNVSDYGRLIWVSTGVPMIKPTPSVSNKSVLNLFHFSLDGFYTFIEMLTDEQRELLAAKINEKYGIGVTIDQVVSLILSKFQCYLNAFIDGRSYSFPGVVKEFKKYPLRMDFVAPIGSVTRALVQKRLSYSNIEANNELNLLCEIASSGRELKQNTLSITANQINQLDLVEKIFGPVDSAYVTRAQMNNLAANLYSSLNIVEEYQIPEATFTEQFVNQMIMDMSQSSFSPVAFDDALNSFSKFALDPSQDFKPDIITSDIGKILEVKKVDGYDYVMVNDEIYKAYKDRQKTETSTSSNLDIPGVVNLERTINVSVAKKDEWTQNKTSLNEQLAQLNTDKQSDIQWKIEGNIVKPKSLNVALLKKATFTKTLEFKRTRQQYYDTAFKRQFSLYTSKCSYKLPVKQYPTGIVVPVSYKNIINWFDREGKGVGDYLGWYICDGRNGAPDLRERFLVGYSNSNTDYNKMGTTGGLASVKLTIDEIPNHNGEQSPTHNHQVNMQSSTNGFHSHSYKDVFYCEFSSMTNDYTGVPSNIGVGGGGVDYDNVGHQINRNSFDAGNHNHNFAGTSGVSYANLQFSGNDAPHENRPPYYVVGYIIFLGA